MSILLTMIIVLLFVLACSYCIIWFIMGLKGWYKVTWTDRHKFPFFFWCWAKKGEPSRYDQHSLYRAVRWELGWVKDEEANFDGKEES